MHSTSPDNRGSPRTGHRDRGRRVAIAPAQRQSRAQARGPTSRPRQGRKPCPRRASTAAGYAATGLNLWVDATMTARTPETSGAGRGRCRGRPRAIARRAGWKQLSYKTTKKWRQCGRDRRNRPRRAARGSLGQRPLEVDPQTREALRETRPRRLAKTLLAVSRQRQRAKGDSDIAVPMATRIRRLARYLRAGRRSRPVALSVDPAAERHYMAAASPRPARRIGS